MLGAEGMPYWKRTLDLAVALLALPVLATAAILVAGLHACVSPGPLLFRQTRIGRLGRPFTLRKFRTMHPDADETAHRRHLEHLTAAGGPLRKLDAGRDARVFTGGRLLRASGIDELPQLLNVLRGEMSVVGPRPSLSYELGLHPRAQRARVAVHPGLTGLWQVSGKNRTTFRTMLALDLCYARRRSPGLDLAIIALTPVALLREIADSRRSRPAAASSSPPRPASHS
jgi:lipopolysaccharide/colanic/teichoic acid biosynthesis glycosyltransferase